MKYMWVYSSVPIMQMSSKQVFSAMCAYCSLQWVADQNTQMTLGSNLEILEVASGKRDIIYTVPYSIQAPNWTVDGKNLIFNDYKGLIYRFDLASKQVSAINTGSVTKNNNDHVISFDGKCLGLSSNVNHGRIHNLYGSHSRWRTKTNYSQRDLLICMAGRRMEISWFFAENAMGIMMYIKFLPLADRKSG